MVSILFSSKNLLQIFSPYLFPTMRVPSSNSLISFEGSFHISSTNGPECKAIIPPMYIGFTFLFISSIVVVSEGQPPYDTNTLSSIIVEMDR